MKSMKASEIKIDLVPNVGYVHTFCWGDAEIDGWISWVKCRSERHANRLIQQLGWYDRDANAAGQFFRHTYYDNLSKRLYARAGYDV